MAEAPTSTSPSPAPMAGDTRDTVVFLGGFEFPAQNAAATRIKAVARLFQMAGYRVVLIGNARDPQLSPDALRPVSVADTSAEVWETGYPRSQKEWVAKILGIGPLKGWLEERYGKQLAAIVCYNFPALAQRDAARFARRNGAVAIGDISEWFAARKATSLFSVIKNADTWLRMNRVNRQMDALITSSPFLTRAYQGHVPAILELPTLVQRDPARAAKPITVTPDGAPKRLFFAGTGFDPALLKSDTEGLKDRLDWALDLLGEAAAAGADFRFDIFGVTKDAYLEIIPQHRELVERLAGKIVFHGRQPWDQVIGSLEQADFSFFLRKATRVTLAGFPTKFSEAVTHDTPVITNPLENVVPYLREGLNGLTLPLDDRPRSIQTLMHALTMPAEAVRAMKQYCRDNDPFAPENFVDGVRAMMNRASNKA